MAKKRYISNIITHSAGVILRAVLFYRLNADKLPNVKALREEYAALLAQKRRAYAEYKRAREEMKELYNVKSNVEHLLNVPEHGNERGRDKTRR